MYALVHPFCSSLRPQCVCITNLCLQIIYAFNKQALILFCVMKLYILHPSKSMSISAVYRTWTSTCPKILEQVHSQKYLHLWTDGAYVFEREKKTHCICLAMLSMWFLLYVLWIEADIWITYVVSFLLIVFPTLVLDLENIPTHVWD